MSIYEQMHIKPDDTGAAELNWRRKPRRKFTQAERMAIVKECLVPGASVAEVAQRNQVNANLLFNWKRKHAGEALPAPAKSAALVPVRIVKTRRKPAKRAAVRRAPAKPAGAIEVEVSGARIFLRGAVSETNLSAVLRALARR